MKKYLIVLVVLATLLLSAFNGSYNAIVESTVNDDTEPTPDGPKDGGLQISDQERFIIGVFELEGTDLAVTADQASSLITLWTSMKEYSQQPMQPMDGTPEATPDMSEEPVEPEDNSEEVNTLFEQIEAVMTADQLQAIEDLELDQDSVQKFMEEHGIEMGDDMQPGQGGGDGQTPPEGTPSGDDMPAQGTPPANGEDNPGGQGGEGGPGGGRGGAQVASSNLIDVLIELLESK